MYFSIIYEHTHAHNTSKYPRYCRKLQPSDKISSPVCCCRHQHHCRRYSSQYYSFLDFMHLLLQSLDLSPKAWYSADHFFVGGKRLNKKNTDRNKHPALVQRATTSSTNAQKHMDSNAKCAPHPSHIHVEPICINRCAYIQRNNNVRKDIPLLSRSYDFRRASNNNDNICILSAKSKHAFLVSNL